MLLDLLQLICGIKDRLGRWVSHMEIRACPHHLRSYEAGQKTGQRCRREILYTGMCDASCKPELVIPTQLQQRITGWASAGCALAFPERVLQRIQTRGPASLKQGIPTATTAARQALTSLATIPRGSSFSSSRVRAPKSARMLTISSKLTHPAVNRLCMDARMRSALRMSFSAPSS